MKIASDRWQILSLVIMLVALSYFAAGRFSRHTTGDLVVASLLLWDAVVPIPLYLWWWPRRRALQAAIKKPPLRARMLLLSSILASAVASAGLMIVGIGLLEQDSLELQIFGGLLLAIVSLVVPGWTLWFFRLASRRTNAAAV